METTFWLSEELPAAVMALLLGGVVLAVVGGLFIFVKERVDRRR